MHTRMIKTAKDYCAWNKIFFNTKMKTNIAGRKETTVYKLSSELKQFEMQTEF